jgi:copper chaperone CopZ
MMSHTLQLSASLNKDSAAQLTQSLNSIQGIANIAFAPATNSVHVTFDEDRTSVQELTAVVSRAGYRLADAQNGKSKSGCCGGCCS